MRSHSRWAGKVRRPWRVLRRCSARCEMRGVKSNSVCGVAEHGADGPARRSSSVGRTWRTGPPPSSFAAGCRGPRQDGQAAKTKLLTRSCLRFWTRAWGQRELADERTGRLKSPARLQDLFKGGLDIPPTSNSAHFAANARSGRWTRRSGSRVGRERIAVFADSFLLLEEAPPVDHQLVEQRPGHSAVPIRMVGYFLKPQLRAQHERPGFLTARDHVKRPLGPRAC